MSEFHVECIKVDNVQHHPNADRLDIVKVGEYPVITRRGEFKIGDKTVYIPIDSTVPLKDSNGNKHLLFGFLDNGNGKDRHRLKAKKLRGVFSMGLLIPAFSTMQVGEDYAELHDIQKYEPPITMNVDADKNYGVIPFYDIEGLRKYPDLLQVGEKVVITEKN